MPQRWQKSLAVAGPLGLLVFSLTTLMLSAANAGWFSEPGALPLIVSLGLFAGGAAQVLVGVLEFVRGNGLGFLVFSGYGLFWLTLVTALLLPTISSKIKAPDPGSLALLFLLWAIFTFAALMNSFRRPLVLQLLLATLLLTFIMLSISFALSSWGHSTASLSTLRVAGYLGVVTAAFALYLAAAELNGWPDGIPKGAPRPPADFPQ